jgi:propionate CoA-transferase
MVGGVPSALPSFGSAYNPEAIISPHEMFDMISGGGLDVTCLGIGEIDKDGNNNVSRMGSRVTGPGGFVDITASTKKVIFVGTLCGFNKKTQTEFPKFIDKVTQISFSGKYSPDTQEVFYITEKAVFKLVDHVFTLIEVAPGLDVEKDVIAKMGFRPAISPDLKEMPPEIFQEKWGGLGKTMLADEK